MINKIHSYNTHFTGTTIIQKEGGDVLTPEILKITGESKRGLAYTRLNGYSMIVVEDVFKNEEKNYLTFLKQKGFAFKNFEKIIDHTMHTIQSLTKVAHKAFKTGVL